MFSRKWESYKENLRFKYAPKIANGLIRLSTFQAQLKLKAVGPISVLVDNSVLQHGIIHETAWVSTGIKKWGDVDISTGYAARIPVHLDDDPSREYQNVKFLPGIASLARRNVIDLKTSGELSDERFRKPIGLFAGYGFSDFNVFKGLPIESIDGVVFPTIGPKSWGLPSAAEQQRERLDLSGDPLYKALVEQLGPKNSQDAWHIRTAEIHNCFCFLTMDHKLIRALYSARLREPVKSLRTRIMTPLEFGEYWGMLPFPARLLAYTDPVFHVRADLTMPNSRRRAKRDYRKDQNNK
jgi:hypothetical protein